MDITVYMYLNSKLVLTDNICPLDDLMTFADKIILINIIKILT